VRIDLCHLWLALACCACTSWGQPKPKIASDDRVGTLFTLSPGVVRVQLLVAARCRAVDEQCPAGRPVPGLPVIVRAAIGDKALGTTENDGGFDVPFALLDSLFPNESVGAYQESAPLLVEGRAVSELPVAEIFRTVVRTAVEECDEALSDPQLQPDYAQELLGRMLDLQLLGLSDKQLTARIISLSERIRQQPKSMWSTPGRGQTDSASDDMRGQIWTGGDPDTSRRELGKALTWLPTLCTISIKGGELAGELLLAGPAGIALNILDATIGDLYSDWMIKSCCQRLSQLANTSPPRACRDRRS
jgi:hypothetical protein